MLHLGQRLQAMTAYRVQFSPVLMELQCNCRPRMVVVLREGKYTKLSQDWKMVVMKSSFVPIQ